MTSTLRTLALAILSGVDKIEEIYSKAGIPVPSLNDPFVPSPLDVDDALVDAQRLVAGAASQLIAHTSQPINIIQEQATSMYMSALLGFVVEANIPDILKTAGTQGLAAKDIAASAGVDAMKLARALRYLAVRHTFAEVSPNVFANNRVSSVLIKAKSLDEIKLSPQTRWEGSSLPSLVAHFADESLMSVSSISPFLLDPKGYASPFNMETGSASSLWDWYDKPENVHRATRFSAAMKVGAARYPAETYVNALDWAALKDDSIVVDVGGGIGNVTMHLADAFPHLKYVVQDLSAVITNSAEKFWAAERPYLISNGSVTLQVHDFFSVQPVESAAVYYMRFILHDWDDEKCIKILKSIREAACPSSKLVVWEQKMHHACQNTDFETGALLLHLTSADMHMMKIVNGVERPFSDLIELGNAAGWKYEERKSGNWLISLVFSPA